MSCHQGKPESDSGGRGGDRAETQFSFAFPEDTKTAYAAQLASVPFFVSGQSLGGGLSIAFGLRVQSATENPPMWKHLFAGEVLTAPLVTAGKIPAAPVLFLLRHVFAPLLKKREVRGHA